MPNHPVLELARLLRQPDGDGHPFSSSVLAGLDREERFPAEACAALDRFGLHGFYVDSRYGGMLVDHSELLQLLRTVARHDLTVAVAHGKTFLGSVPTWIAGDHDQAARLAAEVQGGAVVSWALTEQGRGSDLLAGDLSARPDEDTPGQWRLDGEKWLINNATRSRLICVLARTAPEGGPRGFSLFLVDKRRLAPGSYRALPKIPTHGIRGADISGIAFDDARVDGSSLIGEAGSGLETVVKSLQLTRTMCAALSLGAADHGLRLAADFAAGRRLFGRDLADLPRVRRILGEAMATVLAAEAVSVVAARAVHTLTGEMGVVSAVAKAFVPTVVQEMLEQLAELMGVRSFLSEIHEDGAFAKLERDHRIVAIFDGSTPVNRSRLIEHFRILARAYEGGRGDRDAVTATVSLADGVPPFDPERLRVISGRGCSIVQTLPDAVAAVRQRGGPGSAPGLTALAGALLEAVDEVHRAMAAHPPAPRDVPQSAFDLAERYELCFAGAAALHLWLSGYTGPGPVPGHPAESPPRAEPAWVEGVLALVLRHLGWPLDGLAEDVGGAFDRLADLLMNSPGYAPPSLLSVKAPLADEAG